MYAHAVLNELVLLIESNLFQSNVYGNKIIRSRSIMKMNFPMQDCDNDKVDLNVWAIIDIYQLTGKTDH